MNHIVWPLQIKLVVQWIAPITHKKQNKLKIVNRTVYGSERVKPNSSFGEDTHSGEWLGGLKTH